MSREARNLAFQMWCTRMYQSAARVAQGEVARACDLIAEALADDADLTTDYVILQEPFEDGHVLQVLLDRVRTAGLPDAAIVE